MTNHTLTQLKMAKAEVKSEIMKVIKAIEDIVIKLESKKASRAEAIDKLRSDNMKLIGEKFEELDKKSENVSNNSGNIKSWAKVAGKTIRKPVEQLIVVNAAINET